MSEPEAVPSAVHHRAEGGDSARKPGGARRSASSIMQDEATDGKRVEPPAPLDFIDRTFHKSRAIAIEGDTCHVARRAHKRHLGNYRVRMNMADELVAVAVELELPRLDERPFLEVFQQPQRAARTAAPSRRR